jgi:hypothetical protein
MEPLTAYTPISATAASSAGLAVASVKFEFTMVLPKLTPCRRKEIGRNKRDFRPIRALEEKL